MNELKNDAISQEMELFEQEQRALDEINNQRALSKTKRKSKGKKKQKQFSQNNWREFLENENY